MCDGGPCVSGSRPVPSAALSEAAPGTPPPPAPSFSIGWRWWLFFAIWALFFWGVRPVWDPDSARYAEIARETLVDGHWIVPHLNGEQHLTKPPFTYWVSALGMKLFGVNAWGARFFLSLAFLGTIGCVLELARTWGWSRPETRASGLVFATTLLPMASANVLSTDMFLTFWETLGILCLWKVWAGAPQVARWRVGFWLSFGMAFLTKGPPGWLPLLVIALYSISRPGRQRRHGLQPIWGVPLMLLVAGSWFVLLESRVPGVLRHLLEFEVVGRVASDVHERSHSIFFYFLAMPIALLPYVFLAPEFLRRMGRRLRSGAKGISDLEYFSLLWFVVPFVVFNLSSSKMYLYLVPLMVPLALFMGRLLAEWLEGVPGFSARKRLALGFAAGIWVAGWLGFHLLPASLSGDRTQLELARAVVAQDVIGDRTLYAIGDNHPPYSFNFYTGALVRPSGLGFLPTARWLREEEAAGRPSLVIVRAPWVERLTKKHPPDSWEIVVSEGDYAIVRFEPTDPEAKRRRLERRRRRSARGSGS